MNQPTEKQQNTEKNGMVALHMHALIQGVSSSFSIQVFRLEMKIGQNFNIDTD